MARPKKRPDTQLVTARIDAALIARVDAVAPSRTAAIEEGLELWLERREGASSETPPPDPEETI